MDLPFNPLDLPTYIENFVKTCRVIKEYKELDSTHKDLIDRVIASSDRFKMLTNHYIRDSGCYPEATWEYIKQITGHAKLAMDRTLKITMEWKERLGIREKAKRSKMKIFISFFKRFLWQRSAGQRGPEDEDEDEEKEGPSFFRRQVAVMNYLAIGQEEIMSSMISLEGWLDDLNLAILTFNRPPPKPRRTAGTPDNILFVSLAKERLAKGPDVHFVDRNILDPSSLSDIDPEANTGIYRVHSGPYTGCIVDPRDATNYGQHNEEEMTWEETRNVARLFGEDRNAPQSHLSISVGLLPSCGYTDLERNLHAIIFRFLPGYAPPCTLRRLLLDGEIRHSLNDRMRLATRLATSVLVVHSLGLVHKSIKPDCVLVAERMTMNPRKLYPYALGTPFLLSIGSSRPGQGSMRRSTYTYPTGADWMTLYTHPRHLGSHRYKYEMRDDAFSLGVCLLEIALWKSFFLWNASLGEHGEFEGNTDVIDLSPERLNREPQPEGNAAYVDKSQLRQYLLVKAAEELVPPVMGDLFKDVIVTCLTFGNVGGVSGSDAFCEKLEDKTTLSQEEQNVCFVREVVSKLSSIKLS